jgi:solute:Na+ symporter, SSS family
MSQLTTLDWAIIVGFFVFWLVLGAVVSRRAGESAEQFFLAGRSMPWWLLAFSLVATTFAADTPLFVAGLVRETGVAANWEWWALLLSGMFTVFVFAKLWRRSGVVTDLEFYELRYSGRPAAFLRGFRALYLGVLLNIIIMAIVTLAAIKISSVMLGLGAMTTVVVACAITAIFSMMGGLTSVLWVDAFMFVVAMVGSISAAVVALNHPDVGGMSGLLAHSNLQPKLAMLPDFDFHDPANRTALLNVFLIPLLVQWWGAWYPGSEPGGGGYVAQRMLAAKNERHATGAVLFFNAAHYALRPWPWILVGLASLVVFPDIQSLEREFPHVPAHFVKEDLAYPAMLTLLPAGLKGLVMASLIGAYMSTIATHLNWGSSYFVNDFWRRFLRPQASEKEAVAVGRVATVCIIIAMAVIAPMTQSAMKGFDILIQIGAGTGLLSMLRWFWWRINPQAEITGMCVSLVTAIAFALFAPDTAAWLKVVTGVALTTIGWVTVMFLTAPDDERTLREFCKKVKPGGIGWRHVVERAAADGEPIEMSATHIPLALTCIVAGCLSIYGTLFATGFFLYGDIAKGTALTVATLIAALFLWKSWMRISAD